MTKLSQMIDVARCGGDRPVGKLLDLARLLKHVDYFPDLRKRARSAITRPAQQTLGPGNRSRPGIDLGLVMQAEFTCMQGAQDLVHAPARIDVTCR